MSGVDLDEAFGRLAAHEGGAAQIGDLVDRRAGREPMRDLDDLPLGVAEHEQVRLRVQQHGPAHLLAPVVEVRDAAQRRLDAADDDGHILERFARALRVHHHAAIRPLAALATRRVRIIGADALVRGVAVHHRIHVAGGDAEEQVGLAELLERLGALPVRLRDDADAESLRLEQPPHDGHAEAGVVHVRIAGDDDDVAGIPARAAPSRRATWAGTERCRTGRPSTCDRNGVLWRRLT